MTTTLTAARNAPASPISNFFAGMPVTDDNSDTIRQAKTAGRFARMVYPRKCQLVNQTGRIRSNEIAQCPMHSAKSHSLDCSANTTRSPWQGHPEFGSQSPHRLGTDERPLP